MPTPVALNEPLAKLVVDTVRKIVSSGWLLPGQLPNQVAFPEDGILFRNDSEETIPPYGLMQVTGLEELAGRTYHVVDQYDEDVFGGFLFNGHREVEKGDTGFAQRHEPFIAAGDGSTVTAGHLWGAESGEWTIAPNGGPWLVTGENDIASDAVMVSRDIAVTYRGVVTTEITARSGSTEGSGVVTLKTIGASNATATLQTGIDVTTLLSDTSAVDAEVVLGRTTNGRLQVIAEDCGA